MTIELVDTTRSWLVDETGVSSGPDGSAEVNEVIDLFISFAHADNERPQSAAQGWVTTLVSELEKVLRRKLGGKGARIWRDGELAPNMPVTEELLRRVSASRTLLLALSPGYCLSEWCQRELATFAARAATSGQARNLFAIEIEPVGREEWPAALASLTPMRFWAPAGEPPVPRLHGFPQPRSDEAQYWDGVNTLAHLIAERLRAAPGVSPVRPKPAVVLAEATDDLDDKHQAIAATLAQRSDVVVLPARAYPRDNATDFEAAVTSDLRDARLFVQLLGPHRGRLAPGSERSFVVMQAEAARRHRLQMLQWRPPELGLDVIADPVYRSVLEGERVSTRGFEAFRRELLQALDLIVTPPPEPPPPRQVAPALGLPPSADNALAVDGLSLYLQATPEDRGAADEIADQLSNIGATVLLSPDPAPGQTFEQGLVAQEHALRQCHGVLLVYGRSPPLAIATAFQFARRIFGLRRTGVWCAVLDLPPADKPRVPVRSPNLLSIECRQGFDPARLGGFFNALRSADAGAGHA
jgi:hypothetical protein